MDFEDIRRIAITAIFSDDELFAKLTLKGGNALRLVHKIGNRASIDLDLSLETDFDDVEDIQARLFRALTDRFDSAGFKAFDLSFSQRPRTRKPLPHLGGYEVKFKIISKTRLSELGEDIAAMRRNSEVVAPGQLRKFTIHISKYEYCRDRSEADLDDYTIHVYTPEMIAIEKTRAICQQMDEYNLRRPVPKPRARDFYDIYSILAERQVDLMTRENMTLFRYIFGAKEVPLNLISIIPNYREFHRLDWPAVEQTVAGELKDFDFYFNFVVVSTSRLEALWIK